MIRLKEEFVQCISQRSSILHFLREITINSCKIDGPLFRLDTGISIIITNVIRIDAFDDDCLRNEGLSFDIGNHIVLK